MNAPDHGAAANRRFAGQSDGLLAIYRSSGNSPAPKAFGVAADQAFPVVAAELDP